MKTYIITYYENQQGGINNLQVSRVVSTHQFKGVSILKTFISFKMLADKRANAYLKKIKNNICTN